VLIFRVALPEPLIEPGEKLVLAPLGRPLTLRFTASVKPPVEDTVIVKDLLCPAFKLADVGEIESEKSWLATACTARVTVVLWINVPLTPESVIV
jgi:hypothetical protein